MDPQLPPQQPVTEPVQTPPNQIGTPTASTTAPPPRSPGLGKGLILRAIIGLVSLFVLILIIWKVVPMVLPKSDEKVTLNYWGLWEDEAVMKNVFADFQRQHPNITVTYTRQDPKQYRERLVARMNNGTGPDIFRYHNSWVPMIIPMVLPLPNDVISKGDFQKNYYPVMSKDLIRNGAILGIPLSIDTLALFTNTDIFKAAGVSVPSNWDDFAKVARQLTVKDETGKIKTAGVAMGAADNVTHATDIVSLLFIQNGVQLNRIGGNTASAAEALAFYTDFGKGENMVWDTTLDPSTLAFAKGNLAMYFGYSWDIFSMKALNPNLNFQVSPVPSLPSRKMTIASYWVEGVSAKSSHPEEAFLLLKFLSQKDTLEKIYAEQAKTRQFGELYPRVDMADLLKDNPIVSPFILQAAVAQSTPFSSDTQDSGMNAELNGYLNNAIRAAVANTSPESAIETLIQGQAQVVGRYGE